mgnify:CR=1 FL=1
MGFLEFDKVNSLEMFLTDKGKELMLKQNNMGLADLITRFTFYDEDFDYRTTSQVWQNGTSPQPQVTINPGTTTFGINDFGINPVTYENPKWENPTINSSGDTNYHDITDVRGHRGHMVLSCFPTTGATEINDCTNIYCFYDVTSVFESDAIVAKESIDLWITGYTANINTGWTGNVFHIPVYGEKWIASSYYPWHGELDVFAYNTGSGPNVVNTNPNINPTTGSITTYDDGTTIVPDANGNYYGVTGLFNGTLLNQSYQPSFSVLPPGTLHPTTSGSKLEWFVTGCTLDYTTKTDVSVISLVNGNITGTTNASGGYTGTTWPSNMGTDRPVVLWDAILKTPYFDTIGGWDVTTDYHSSFASKSKYGDKCNQNCCADDADETGSLFGCDGCNPFNNTVTSTSGETTEYTVNRTITMGVSQFPVTENKLETETECKKYKGGDRNVMVINTTDETQGKHNHTNWGGIMPLGEKTYYGEGNVTVGTPTTTTLGVWGAGFGPAYGYHIGHAGSDGLYPTQTIANLNYNMGWTPISTTLPITTPVQPTTEWLYSQDLHLRTLPFYDNFIGFLYPVTKSHKVHITKFLQHSYAAIQGGTVSAANLPNNPTLSVASGWLTSSSQNALTALTTYNPYSQIIPVQYLRPDPPYGPTITPAWGHTQQGGTPDQMMPNTSQPITSGLESSWSPTCALSGLKNYGWGMDPEIGCILPNTSALCSGTEMFSASIFGASLNDFLTGGTVGSISNVCTFCQCLPSVFVNRRGPIESTGGCINPPCNPCPNPPCTPPPVVVDQLCGPTPVLGTTINTNFTASNPFAPNKNDK